MKRFLNPVTTSTRTQPAMQTNPAPRRRRTALAAVLAVAPAALGLTACHDLTEQPPSSIAPSTFYQTDAQVTSGLAGVYAGLRTSQGNAFFLAQVSSDETIVPTRGTDWLDGGQWVELWQHTYGPSSGAGRQTVNNAYNDLSAAIARANSAITTLQSSPAPSAQEAVAEARAVRAYFYYQIQDLFGGVPLVTDVNVSNRPRVSRDSVARFVEAELLAVRPTIPATQTGANQGRITQGGVDAMLASLYLNWPVFTGTPTASGITLGSTQRYQDVITVTDRILASGAYSLVPDSASWVAMFSAGNQGSKENIFVVSNQAKQNPNLGLDLVGRAVHYNSYSNSGGYNGFSTVADTYNQFDPTDSRRGIFLAGNQVTIDFGKQAYLRDGKTPLNFTASIASINAAAENEGIRWYKFKLDPAHVGDQNGVDFPIFRLSGVLLDRAEALWRLGRTGEATVVLNQLRTRNKVTTPVGALSASVFLHERLNELAYEGKRRQDMIRLGSFTSPKTFKTGADAGYQVVFPIPTAQIQANPLLTQNPGYGQ